MISVDSMIKRTLLVATAAAAALAAFGCGGDSPAATGDSFWTDTYNPAGLPAAHTTPTKHTAALGHPGNCLMAAGCHVASPGYTPTIAIAWGGVVYQADGKTRAPNVEVGVVSGTYKSFAYSRSDGVYWVEGTPPDAATWSAADIRIRNVNGEKAKLPSHDRGADCDSCHKETGGTATPLKAR
jgi:hypothetical protein